MAEQVNKTAQFGKARTIKQAGTSKNQSAAPSKSKPYGQVNKSAVMPGSKTIGDKPTKRNIGPKKSVNNHKAPNKQVNKAAVMPGGGKVIDRKASKPKATSTTTNKTTKKDGTKVIKKTVSGKKGVKRTVVTRKKADGSSVRRVKRADGSKKVIRKSASGSKLIKDSRDKKPSMPMARKGGSKVTKGPIKQNKGPSMPMARKSGNKVTKGPIKQDKAGSKRKPSSRKPIQQHHQYKPKK